jgi:hypothetical protein
MSLALTLLFSPRRDENPLEREIWEANLSPVPPLLRAASFRRPLHRLRLS